MKTPEELMALADQWLEGVEILTGGKLAFVEQGWDPDTAEGLVAMTYNASLQGVPLGASLVAWPAVIEAETDDTE